MATESFAGPVGYLVFDFPPGASIGAGLQSVLSRADEGLIAILDLEFIGRGPDGRSTRLSIDEVQDATGSDLKAFIGAESGILDQEDLDEIAGELDPGHFAIALVFEERSLASAADAWAAVGGIEIFAGGVALTDLEAVLDSLDEGNNR